MICSCVWAETFMSAVVVCQEPDLIQRFLNLLLCVCQRYQAEISNITIAKYLELRKNSSYTPAQALAEMAEVARGLYSLLTCLRHH